MLIFYFFVHPYFICLSRHMRDTFRLFAGRWWHSCQDVLLFQRLVFRILHVSQQIVEEVVQLQNTHLVMRKSVLHLLNLSTVCSAKPNGSRFGFARHVADIFRWISELWIFSLWSCGSLPRPTTPSDWKLLGYVTLKSPCIILVGQIWGIFYLKKMVMNVIIKTQK